MWLFTSQLLLSANKLKLTEYILGRSEQVYPQNCELLCWYCYDSNVNTNQAYLKPMLALDFAHFPAGPPIFYFFVCSLEDEIIWMCVHPQNRQDNPLIGWISFVAVCLRQFWLKGQRWHVPLTTMCFTAPPPGPHHVVASSRPSVGGTGYPASGVNVDRVLWGLNQCCCLLKWPVFKHRRRSLTIYMYLSV